MGVAKEIGEGDKGECLGEEEEFTGKFWIGEDGLVGEEIE